MKRLLTIPLCLGFAFALGAAELPPPEIPLNCGVQMKGDTFNLKTLEEVYKLGFRIVRRGFYWHGDEKERGVYKFPNDPQMAFCKERGITVVGVIFGCNKLYEDDGKGGIQTEEGRKGYAAYAAALAEHYKGQNVVWEIWNEPNVQTFWRKGKHNSEEFAEEYSALVNETVPAMLKADPKCCVVAGSVSNYWQPSFEWTEFCFRRGVLKSGIRAWSVHPYGVKTPEEHKWGHDITRELMKKYGAPDMPIVDTERGFTAEKRNDITIEGWSGGKASMVKDYQAWHIVRQFLADQASGLAFTSWYELKGNEGFTLYEKDGSHRPALKAYLAFVAELTGYRFESSVKCASPRDRVSVYVNKKSERKAVVWTAPGKGESPDLTIEHDAALRFDRKDAAAKELEVADLLGDKRKLAVGKSFRVTGAPQYVALPSGVKVTGLDDLGNGAYPDGRKGEAPKALTELDKPLPLKIFDGGAQWRFEKNTGDGSVSVGKVDGRKAMTVSFDFSASTTKQIPYVIASTACEVKEGASLNFKVRAAKGQRVTYRLVDGTGQTLQFKQNYKKGADWADVRIPFDRKMEHWGGANDGKIHLPLKAFCVSVPKSKEVKGKVEFAEAFVK